MTAQRPGDALRPHVKAFKSTAVAARLADAGHRRFCCATVREVEGLAAAGLDDDLLLANEVLDATRLGAVAAAGARVTVAVDSEQTIDAAVRRWRARGADRRQRRAAALRVRPRSRRPPRRLRPQTGLDVRGVMGYEGHLMDWTDRARQAVAVEQAMSLLLAAHDAVGGDIVSAGGTGTFDINTWANEIQAGSYLFMDTHYAKVGLPFAQALSLLTTVISVNRAGGWVVATVASRPWPWTTATPPSRGPRSSSARTSTHVRPRGDASLPSVGDRVRVVPAHVDPTVAYHERMHVVRGDQVVDDWPIDLRGW